MNNMEAITYQVTIPKPIQGEIDTDVGDNIEIAKSWENYISKKVGTSFYSGTVLILR
ncbi:MAG: hypothetical protein U9N36_09420 [Euryarchaeota archaeon]|nr:hypothetical protein [Euryarchaeota archaeon]